MRGRLLILDDDEAVGATLGRLARRMGMETRVVTRSAPFFSELELWAPTHLALDLVMPETDGVQVLRLLAERGCRAMIIITSGIGNRVLEAAQRSAEEYNLNIAGILSKPFNAGILRELLERQPYLSARPPVFPPPSNPTGVITETDLRQAIAGRQLELAYQPKITCATGRLAGFEALVRWRRPSGEVVMPDRFIPLAEQSDVIDGLTAQVCDMALRWVARRPDSAALTMSVNFSARNLQDTRLADRLSDLCAELGLEPGRVIVELTETSAMEDPLAALALLTRLRVKGFQLSIDDFGTGYSSMVQLVRLPFSEMKVDKSLVINSARSEEARTVIKSIVDLGHSLGLVLTAEGVEDAGTLKFLDGVGCDLAQGYHIARPMPGEDVSAWIACR